MPVVAAAPEKITPLIKRLRVSLEFTDIAPFWLLDCRINALRFTALLLHIYLLKRLDLFALKSNEFGSGGSAERQELRGFPSACLIIVTLCYKLASRLGGVGENPDRK